MFNKQIKDVVIFGECMIEFSSNDNGSFNQGFAGDTFNTAVYLKRCLPSVNVRYLTGIGKDIYSEKLLQLAEDEELDLSLFHISENRGLGAYVINTDVNGERNFHYWRDNSAARQAIYLHQSALTNADLFYFSGISLAILDDIQRERLFSHLAELKSTGCVIAFDPNYRPQLWKDANTARRWTDKAYAMSDIVFPGMDDHCALYGHKNTAEIIEHLAPHHIAEIVIKSGIENINIYCNNHVSVVPVTPALNVIDTTAAGDSFNGGYFAARLAQKQPPEAASYAAAVSSEVICHKGAILDKETFRLKVDALI